MSMIKGLLRRLLRRQKRGIRMEGPAARIGKIKRAKFVRTIPSAMPPASLVPIRDWNVEKE